MSSISKLSVKAVRNYSSTDTVQTSLSSSASVSDDKTRSASHSVLSTSSEDQMSSTLQTDRTTRLQQACKEEESETFEEQEECSLVKATAHREQEYQKAKNSRSFNIASILPTSKKDSESSFGLLSIQTRDTVKSEKERTARDESSIYQRFIHQNPSVSIRRKRFEDALSPIVDGKSKSFQTLPHAPRPRIKASKSAFPSDKDIPSFVARRIENIHKIKTIETTLTESDDNSLMQRHSVETHSLDEERDTLNSLSNKALLNSKARYSVGGKREKISDSESASSTHPQVLDNNSMTSDNRENLSDRLLLKGSSKKSQKKLPRKFFCCF